MKMILIRLLLLVCIGSLHLESFGQALAFPGAEGFGKFTSGGRGGKILKVTNLNDSGEGSLRKAIQSKGPRIIIFDVSGTISLEGPLDVNNGDLTIAGQSAPGDGVCIKNFPVSIKADNVIVRFMRFRMGDERGVQGDALGGTKGVKNIIIDHCSISWATDECASFYNNTNFTLQWCFISESLNASLHEKGQHGYGGIWGGRGATFHHNLIASHHSRMPRFSGSSTTPNSELELVDFRNNVIYNWEINNIYGGEKGKYNVVNNYYKPGPATPKSKLSRLLNPSSPFGKFFVAGNVMESNAQVSLNNWAGGVQCDSPDSAKADTPFPSVELNEVSASDAYMAVLQFGGASLRRDAADARLIKVIKSGKSNAGSRKTGIIDSQKDVGGWPELKSCEAPKDSDGDGMPDKWEIAKGLNPSDAMDGRGFTMLAEFSNVEVYLNSLIDTRS